MPWIRNEAIGNVWVSDLNIEFDFYETKWIEQEDFEMSESLRESLNKGILKVISTKRGPSRSSSDKTRAGAPKTRLTKNNKMFPFGKVRTTSPTEVSKIRADKIKSYISNLYDSEVSLEVEFKNEVSDDTIEKIFKEQRKTSDILNDLKKEQIVVKVDGTLIEKTKITSESPTYMPKLKSKSLNTRIQKTSIKSNSNLDDSSEKLKSLKD